MEKTDLFRAFRSELYNIGSIYFQRKDFSKAIEFYQKTTQKYNLDIGNSSGKVIAYAFIRLGLCYLLMEEHSLSQEAFFKAEEVAKLNSVGKSALLYYFLQKNQTDEKQVKKYHKMYLSRLKREDKISLQHQFEDNFIPFTDQKQILADFESISI